MPSNHLTLCHLLLLLPLIFPSIRIFSTVSALHIRWLKCWSFSLSISLSNENSELVSFKIDWFDHLAVQGTLKSLLQYHSLKASILYLSAFFMVQLFTCICDYWKNHRSDYIDFYLCFFNTLSRFVTAFLPRSKCLLILHSSSLMLYSRSLLVI